ncbi:beta-glucosidase-like glycosyl hydrolase/polygalacturonase [Pedobacter africanus]|uniref:Beta-glucosidase-like glycosyl hydrolase/polygalacturonase n=1 Tax=Pedobacter africanus TaxID=151894 RepID=A0ACC6KV76_9SPHI|nr:glycoside hydrolase family 3 C-terminal domain-containing protein [Pedobacter africanus]MDR6783268.1 beta-glucosidase-like glycosyl hydrolase/polygalacturonase [Pedobacter africanus]
MRVSYLLWKACCLLLFCFPCSLSGKSGHAGPGKVYNILSYGARPDGQQVNTRNIQQAIDECARNKGGSVVVPAGKFVTGTLYLKSKVNLHLEKGATLSGSTDLKDYPVNPSKIFEGENKNLSLIFAENANNVSISGTGEIDGNGWHAVFARFDNNPRRPKILLFLGCKNVSVSDITLRNSAFWVQHYLGCDQVNINGIKVYSHANFNNDGIDIDSKNVTISDCIIDTDDDALCFKSDTRFPCENVKVTNCVLSSNCNAIKMGTASFGGFKNISISNCEIKLPSEDKFRNWSTKITGISSAISTLSGIALEIVDGGAMDGISISDINMMGVQTPIFIKLGNRRPGKDKNGNPVPGSLKNISIRNIQAKSNSLMSSSITGMPGHEVSQIRLENLSFKTPGGGTRKDAERIVPENEKDYPENRMFGFSLPASGFYVRHASQVSLKNVSFHSLTKDERPLFFFDDVKNSSLNGIHIHTPTGGFCSFDAELKSKTGKLPVFTGWKDLNGNQKKDAYEDPNESINSRVKNLLSLLSLEEKVATIHGSSTFTSGGVARLGIPPINMSDGPHGVRLRPLPGKKEIEGSVTYLPVGNALGATWNTELGYAYGKVLGQEARYWGKDILLGPGVNIIRTPLNGRNFEYLGEDPFLVSKMGLGYVKGIQDQGISACVKHLAVNNQEFKRNFVDVQVSERALREIYLPAFRVAVEEGGVHTIMGAYNKLRGQYCTHNDYLINKILKGEWAFKGIQISDWGAVHDTMEALMNGTDIEMGTPKKYFMGDTVVQLVKSGKVPLAVIDNKVERILGIMFKTGMFDNRDKGSIEVEKNQAMALKIAEEGIVLLKNNNKVLPFKAEQIRSVAVIGALADYTHHGGGGSSRVPARYEVTPLQGLKKLLGNNVRVQYEPGYLIQKDYRANALRIADAVKAAKQADAVVLVAGWIHGYGEGMEQEKNPAYDAEGKDKQDLILPFGQDELIVEVLKANPNAAIVLVGGGAMDMRKWEPQANAMLEAWYPGTEGGRAIANILFGKVNPSGKLPVTFPKKLEDVAAHALGDYPGDSKTFNLVYHDDLFVGYRYNDTYKVAPQFAFGHGLSYTNFAYSNASLSRKAEELLLKFTLRNTGKTAGAEVAQVYTSYQHPKVTRPLKELKAFKKVLLNPGESREIVLSIPLAELRYYNESKGYWELEPGLVQVMIGSSSADIRLEQKIVL